MSAFLRPPTAPANRATPIICILILAAGLSAGLVGCVGHSKPDPASLALQVEGRRFGQWRGKALVADPRDGKQRTVSLDVVAAQPDRLRIDLSGTLGTYLGTFAAGSGKFSWLSPLEKRFVSGKSDSAAAQATLQLPVGPEDVIALLFGQPMRSGWSCQEFPTEGRRACSRPTEGSAVSVEKEGDSRRFVMSGPGLRAPAQMVLEEVRTNGQPEDKSFVLERPDSYADAAPAP